MKIKIKTLITYFVVDGSKFFKITISNQGREFQFALIKLNCMLKGINWFLLIFSFGIQIVSLNIQENIHITEQEKTLAEIVLYDQ